MRLMRQMWINSFFSSRPIHPSDASVYLHIFLCLCLFTSLTEQLPIQLKKNGQHLKTIEMAVTSERFP